MFGLLSETDRRRIVQKIGSMAKLVPAATGASNSGAHFDLRLKTKDKCVHLDFLQRLIRKGGSAPPSCRGPAH